jgi:transcriptional regulator with XRE-family HTH domain
MEDSNFGHFLKSLRDRQRMSLRDVEKESGVSNAYIAQLEKGDRPAPSPDILKKLARAYNVTVRELLLRVTWMSRR